MADDASTNNEQLTRPASTPTGRPPQANALLCKEPHIYPSWGSGCSILHPDSVEQFFHAPGE